MKLAVNINVMFSLIEILSIYDVTQCLYCMKRFTILSSLFSSYVSSNYLFRVSVAVLLSYYWDLGHYWSSLWSSLFTRFSSKVFLEIRGA